METTTLEPYVKLQLNINFPDLEDCYLEGYEAAQQELGEELNPYSECSAAFEQWQEGWWAGLYNEAPLVAPLEKDADVIVEKPAANDYYYYLGHSFFINFLKITSALAATAFVGYQVLELVA